MGEGGRLVRENQVKGGYKLRVGKKDNKFPTLLPEESRGDFSGKLSGVFWKTIRYFVKSGTHLTPPRGGAYASGKSKAPLLRDENSFSAERGG